MPTSLIFDRQLSPATIHTWVQLRALAWGKPETPALSVQQLAEITGKKPSTLYGHMAALRDRDALRWRPADRSTIIVSFPEAVDESEAVIYSDNLESLSRKPEKPSLNYSTNADIDSIEEEKRGGRFQKSGKLTSTPAQLYRKITGISPNAAQRELIAQEVSDLAVWESSVEHWLSHGWNPRNLPGILDLYRRGGAVGCRFCQKAATTKPRQGGSASELDLLRKEYQDGYTE